MAKAPQAATPADRTLARLKSQGFFEEPLAAAGKVPAFEAAAFGVLLDGIAIGPKGGFGNWFPISDFDARIVDGDAPSICPNADRRPPAAWLPTILEAFRRAGLAKPGQTIHWVGSQSKPENVCICGATPAAAASPAPMAAASKPKAKKAKQAWRSDGELKLIAALTKHHRYADGGVLNQEAIGNNELAKQAGAGKARASAFFKKRFGGYKGYKRLCATDAASLHAALKILNDDVQPADFLRGDVPDRADRRIELSDE
jgi:hypothetical protein